MITAAWPDGSAIHFIPTRTGFIGEGSPPRVFNHNPAGTLSNPPTEPVITIQGVLTLTAPGLRALADLIETGACHEPTART